MSEYIDREELIEICENQGHADIDDILSVPVSDVAIVVHAKWIEKSCITGKYFECSNCHKPENKHTAIKGRYCWFCGAKMDAE